MISAFCQVTVDLPEGFSEHTLSNGMRVFILEDFSNALVRIEYTSRAGLSMQTQETDGFFPLYTKLFLDSGKSSFGEYKRWYCDDFQSECNADSARYYGSFAPSVVADVLEQLSSCAFSPIFPDDKLKSTFNEYKSMVLEESESVSGFINGSINTRLFPESPWKQDNCINPSLFKNLSLEQVRSAVSAIGRNYYSPQNSAVFISGAISEKDALSLAEKTFGKYDARRWVPLREKTSTQNSPIQNSQATNSQELNVKRFVLSDEEFASDFTQIVMQYTDFSMNDADIIANAINRNASNVKSELLSISELAIRASEYIDAGAVHKNGSSRLIIQSLLERSKKNPVEQSEVFIKTVQNETAKITSDAFTESKNILCNSYRAMLKDSSVFMELLSQFWAVDGIPSKELLGTGENGDFSSLVQRLLQRPLVLENANPDIAISSLQDNTLYVFVLVNNEVYKKNKKLFTKNGYELVTRKNALWYTLKEYKKPLDTAENKTHSNTEQDQKDFAKENRKLFSYFTLKNGIPVVVKQKDVSETVAVSIIIDGGELNDKESSDYGFESVLINALAQNIQNGVSEYVRDKKIKGEPSIFSETNISSSAITIECLYEDIDSVFESISNTLVFGDIIPSDADALVFDRRSQQIMKVGNPVYQLYANGIKRLYSNYQKLFSLDDDILKKVSYDKILTAYPALLDASRFSIVISGKVQSSNIQEKIEKTFGVLSTPRKSSKTTTLERETPNTLPKDTAYVKIVHKFLTDVSADKAGPRPLVLIPTTDFSDPVQFWIKSPVNQNDKAIFTALMYEVVSKLNSIIENTPKYKGITIQLKPDSDFIQFAVLTFINVKYTSYADELYAKALSLLNDELFKVVYIEVTPAEPTQSDNNTVADAGSQPSADSETADTGNLTNANNEVANTGNSTNVVSEATDAERAPITQDLANVVPQVIPQIIHNEQLVQEIKNLWLLNTLSLSLSNRQTTLLIKQGLDLQKPNAEQYLDNWETVMNGKTEMYEECFKNYLLQAPTLKLYSVDSKK